MKLSNNIISKLGLTAEEVEGVKQALSHNDAVAAFIIRYIKYRQGTLKTTVSDFDRPNWEFRRAFLDGRINELNWLLTLLTKGETDE